MTNEPLLKVTDLHVRFSSPAGEVRAVNGVSFELAPGEILGIVGESGSGKSTLASAIMNLITPPGRISGGSVTFQGQEMDLSSGKALSCPEGIRMIFQDPMSSLDPFFTVESQMLETLRAGKASGSHSADRTATRREERKTCADMLQLVGLEPETVLKRYSFELSGGQQQRIMIALSLLSHPALLIADEPTTALDVTIQDQILSLIRSLQQQTGMAVLFVTHNLGIVADLCQRVMVMYGGEIMESASCEDLFDHPVHPYTRGLLRSLPKTEPYIAGMARQKLVSIGGPALDMANLPEGCMFAERCPCCMEKCKTKKPALRTFADGHLYRCHLEGGAVDA